MGRWILRIALGLVVIAAGIGLWRWSGTGARAPDLLFGSALFRFSPAEVESFEVRRLAGTTVLRRDAAGRWLLTGLVNDLVHEERAVAVLAALVSGDGYAELPGTEPDERRFGFGNETWLEIVFHLREGSSERIALGDANPVAEMIYASGAGRRHVFGVGGDYYTVAASLPDNLRLPRLLPPLRAADADSLRIDRRGDGSVVCANFDDERWWLRLPDGAAVPAGKSERYHSRYTDRRLERGGATWLLADVRRIREIVFRATDTALVSFPEPDRDAPDQLAEYGLLPFYRGLTIYAAGGDSLRVEFGEQRGEPLRVVPARRQGTLVIARAEALWPLEGSLQEFIELGALSFRPEAADSFRVDEPSRPLLWARRAAASRGWEPIVPEGWRLTFGREDTANHLADLQMNLDRLECLDVMAPAPADPLQSDERWRLRAWLPGGRAHEVWLGRLADDGRPVVWDPQDGKCLEIPEQLLISLRNMRRHLQPI
ncbi:MAG: hypothetical protein RBT60_01315 [Candidatus Krumholzibacteria bacterium]|jgi:hypothetical protein|nr:hypothetical protein [Candidatus Krumholzibacteria bacterium]